MRPVYVAGVGVKMEQFQAALDPRKQELLEARFLGARVSSFFIIYDNEGRELQGKAKQQNKISRTIYIHMQQFIIFIHSYLFYVFFLFINSQDNEENDNPFLTKYIILFASNKYC